MKFEVGERVQFIYASKLRTGRINSFSSENGELYAHIEFDGGQVCVKVTADNIAKLDQPEPQSEKVKKINEIMLELIHRKDMDILSDDDITRMLIEALDIVNTLDEPKPVVVPKFVAEWYEESKHRLDSALWDVIGSLRFTNASELTPVQNFIYTSGETIETLSAMKNGYVVAEEKEYYVELIPTVEGYLNLLTETETYEVNSAPECKGHKTKFTEKEIKAIDERLWAFAVPAEEVEAE